MRLVVDCHQIGEGDLGVFLGGGEPRVAEEFLDGAEVGAVAQQVSCECVAEAVRVDGSVTGERRGVELDDAASAAVGQGGRRDG